MKRQLTIKPTCMREIVAFPSDRAAVLWEKIDQLLADPVPDGKVRKKLKGGDGLYRLRVGDHRVFYSFGPDWVSLLGVRKRREDTYDSMPGAEPGVVAPDEDADIDALLAGEASPRFQFETVESGTPLPRPLTPEWLRDLGVPASAIPMLVRCKSEDDLLDAMVDPEVLARVVDAVFPPSLTRVALQPDLVVPSPEHLVRYKEGDLLGFLLRLDEDQRALIRWALKGPTMVRGGAGTGKSTVALYRVKELLERPGATGKERVLFTTYTRALLTATRQLLEQVLRPEQLARVTVATCDQVAMDVVRRHRTVGTFESDRDGLRRLAALRRNFKPSAPSAFEATLRTRALARLSDAYLIEEFDWILDGRGLTTLAQYQEAPRPGRGVAFSERTRAVVWEFYQAFVEQGTAERFPALRREALALAQQGSGGDRYDYVLVDEAQDLSPIALALLAEMCASAEGLFFAADSKQSLYSRSYSWAAAHPRLQFRGRTALLRRNYRSTTEIDRAAFGLLRPAEGEALEPSQSVHDGPLPVLVRGVPPEDEAQWVARFIRQMARHLHLRTSAAAVLVPIAAAGEALAEDLTRAGLPARFFPGRELDLKADVVRVLTLHSAKGLEFPIVAVAGWAPGTYPVREDYDDEGLYAERVDAERRLLYVGLTRAMRGLLLSVQRGCSHPVLADIDPSLWHVEEVS
jgi:mRNA-degrading endonuclease RelE of RelBE toxin-antitoxin system